MEQKKIKDEKKSVPGHRDILLLQQHGDRVLDDGWFQRRTMAR
jgi:hypothetical protein